MQYGGPRKNIEGSIWKYDNGHCQISEVKHMCAYMYVV